MFYFVKSRQIKRYGKHKVNKRNLKNAIDWGCATQTKKKLAKYRSRKTRRLMERNSGKQQLENPMELRSENTFIIVQTIWRIGMKEILAIHITAMLDAGWQAMISCISAILNQTEADRHLAQVDRCAETNHPIFDQMSCYGNSSTNQTQNERKIAGKTKRFERKMP